jgi:hypothetical protein
MNDKTKKVIKYSLISFIAVSIAFAVTNEAREKSNAKGSVPVKSEGKGLKNKVVAYYFHGNVRCPSCLKIEKYSYEAVQKYTTELKDGSLEWYVINVEEAPNKHFVKDYNLYTKSLVISLVKNGEQKAWKNLERVWDNLHDQESFHAYVQNELNNYFKELRK